MTKTWYESLSYKENPFSSKPTQRYVIKGNLVSKKTIFSAVEESHIGLIYGKYGAGKTTLLKQIIKKFGGQKKVVYFSCNRLNRSLDIDKLLYERFGLITKILRIKSKQMILLLDEAQHLSEDDFATLRNYYDKKYLKSIVLVSHDKMSVPDSFCSDLVEVEIVSPDVKNAISIIRQRIGDHPLFSDEVIAAIYEYDSRMRAFLKNCDTFIRRMIEKKRKTARVSDVKRVLKRHAY